MKTKQQWPLSRDFDHPKRRYALIRLRDRKALAYGVTRVELSSMQKVFMDLGIECEIMVRSQGPKGSYWDKEGVEHNKRREGKEK